MTMIIDHSTLRNKHKIYKDSILRPSEVGSGTVTYDEDRHSAQMATTLNQLLLYWDVYTAWYYTDSESMEEPVQTGICEVVAPEETPLDDKIQKRLEALQEIAGLLNDVSKEDLRDFDEAVRRRPLFAKNKRMRRYGKVRTRY